MANAHPKLKRGLVQCRQCKKISNINIAGALQYGWPKCHGRTMTLDVIIPPKKEATSIHFDEAKDISKNLKPKLRKGFTVPGSLTMCGCCECGKVFISELALGAHYCKGIK